MKTIGTFEAKTHLSRILDDVANGETYTVTRNGLPVAEIRPVRAPNAERVREAIAGLRAIRDRVKPDPDGMTIRQMIELGRRF